MIHLKGEFCWLCHLLGQTVHVEITFNDQNFYYGSLVAVGESYSLSPSNDFIAFAFLRKFSNRQPEVLHCNLEHFVAP